MKYIIISMDDFLNKYKNIKKIDSQVISWFTDGSCSNNGKKKALGGFAAICVSGNKKNTIIYGRVDDRTIKATNIRAEGMAILSVLEDLIITDNWNEAVIYSDSEFWIKMIYDYMPKWKPQDFDQKANPDLTKKIYNLYNRIKRVEFKHVYAHNKDKSATSTDPFKRFCHDNNELVDNLANIAKDLPGYDVKKIVL
jgi:ribonuclease HI